MSVWRFGALALPAIAMLGACAPTDDAIPPACTLDDFASSSIDTRVWGVYEQPPSTIGQQDGELLAVLADGAVAYTSVYSVAELDFHDTSVAVEVVEAPSVEGVEVLLQWVVNNKFAHFIAVEAGQIYFGTRNDEAFETAETPYDPIAHRHWRLRHERDQIYYETSADRASWAVGHISGVSIPLEQAYVELAAGSYLEVERAGTAAFDNFELAGACAP